jgi:alcohol dehydrogenase
LAHSLGAHHVINGTGGDVGAQLRALGGANVVLSTTLDTQLIAGAMQGLATEGALVLAAVTVESIPVVPALLLAFQHRIVGSLVGSRGDMQELLQLAAKHKIRPMTEIYPLEQANEVHARLRAQQVRFRAVLTPA